MAVDPSTPVSAIEGIGPAIESRLQAIGIWFVYDLLRSSRNQIRGAVSDVASADQVATWRAMASLLDVDQITPQWAEALVKQGVESVEELQGTAIGDLETLFADAHAAGFISSEPTADDGVTQAPQARSELPLSTH